MSTRQDPYLGFRFRVEMDGLLVAGFSEVSGIEIRMEPESYDEGGRNGRQRQLPTRYTHPNLVLERGLTDSRELWEWTKNAIDGRIERKNGRILLLDTAGETSWDWVFTDAYPVRWTGPTLQADQGAVAVETLELVHEGFSP